jgi:hypothetical protein
MQRITSNQQVVLGPIAVRVGAAEDRDVVEETDLGNTVIARMGPFIGPVLMCEQP